ncbi:hypothetical protein MKZ38_000057 [Zalerion maritima]|uniref:Abscission/NoCut checkpoint regulator n=1 Tax=Zalerion maritima TaxID=339359 RepID=A0AAD5RGB8_9PEZI|nr:hypothetical protein MKZ38_000057 [Zalerion maritima]
MSDPSGDQGLWDRLKELKKGTSRDIPDISPSSSSNETATARIHIPLNSPPTAHDRLSDRLKLLRLQHEQGDASREAPAPPVTDGGKVIAAQPQDPTPKRVRSIPKVDATNMTSPPTQKRGIVSAGKPEQSAGKPSFQPCTTYPQPTGSSTRGPESGSGSKAIVSSTKVEPSISVEASLKASMAESLLSGPGSSPDGGGMAEDPDPDSFLQSDDQTLEELLADLELDEDLDPEPPSWALQPPYASLAPPTEAPMPDQPAGGGDGTSEHESEEDVIATPQGEPEEKSTSAPQDDADTKSEENVAPEEITREPSPDRVAALLEDLSQRPMPESNGEGGTEAKDRNNGSDDSDGEIMKDEVDKVLERAADEIALEREESTVAPKATWDNQDNKGSDVGKESDVAGGDGEPTDWSLPEPPSTNTLSTGPPTNPSGIEPLDLDSRMAALLSSRSSLAPSQSNDQPPPSNPDPGIPNFTARLASLQALRASSGSSSAGGINLPDVPANAPGTVGWKKSNFTDEEMETWCTVCLADATLICPGCDGEPYCTRCWHALHTGPQAGFDERTHRAEILERGKKKEKRVLVGA